MAKQVQSRKRDLIAFVIMTPVFFAVSYMSTLEKGFLSLIVVYTFYVLISEKWAEAGRISFWVLVASLAAIHVAVIINLDLRSRITPALICLPFAVVDFAFMWFVIDIYARLTRRAM